MRADAKLIVADGGKWDIKDALIGNVDYRG
jgi:hypothetical protein